MAVDFTKIPDIQKPHREGSIRGVLRNYPDATNIISEFIQNAEDANSTRIEFEVSHDCVRITNDGGPFDEQDYGKLIEFARGKWGEVGKIGKFGVGFISAYHLTDSPTIISNGAKVTIKPDGRVRKRKDAPSEDSKGSVFVLPLRRTPTWLSKEIDVGEITEELLSRFVASFKERFYRCILFLDGERIIEGSERSSKNRRLVCRCVRKPVLRREDYTGEGKNIHYERVLISTEWRDAKSRKWVTDEPNEWMVFSQDFKQEYVQTYGDEPPARTKVSLAFKLRDRNPDEVGHLHAFLPTAIRTGLPFNVNADFAPRTGRDDIIEGESAEALWNTWLVECLGMLSASIIDHLKDEVDTPASFYELIPIDYAEDRPYLKTIVDMFIDGARDKAIVFSSEHGWLTRHESYWVDMQLRKIAKGAGAKFVAPEIQDNDRATKLFDKIGVELFESRHLISLLGQIPIRCSLRKAPRFVRSNRKISTIYRYLHQNEYPGMWDDLKEVSLCPDQFDILHPFNSSEDKVYRADTEMRRILTGSEVPLVRESLWKSHKEFLKKLVERFDMDHLIRYLDEMKDECVGKKLHQSPMPILSSVAKVNGIYKYLKKYRVFKASEWREGAMEGTPLCVADDDTIRAFSKENPPVFLATREIRTILSRSKVNFVKKDLQKRHRDFLSQAGIPEFGVGEQLRFLCENTTDGIPLQKAAGPLNTESKVLSIYRYLRRAKLNQEQLDTLKTMPVFLTSKGNLRPLVGSDQGPLQLGLGKISDPLNLDNVLGDVLSKDRQLRKWLKDKLDVQELNLARYVSEYLVPRYASAPPDVKLDLLRMLRANLKAIQADQELQKLLKSAELIQCQDGEYRHGPKVCFKSRRIDAAFDGHYYYPSQIYAQSRKAKGRANKEEWVDLFKSLGVRQKPDPEAVVRAAASLSENSPTEADVQRARQLLKFLNNHWEKYEKDQEELKELQYLKWLPAKGDQSQLYYPYELYLPEVEDLIATQARFVAITGLNGELALLLGVHTEAQTDDIVNHLLELSESRKTAKLAIYEELDRRRDGSAMEGLRHEDIVDVTEKGEFWNPDRLFFGECSADFGKYRRRLPDNLCRFSWLFREIGVRTVPEPRDYVELLLEISSKFGEKRLPRDETSLVQRAYVKLARDLEQVSYEQWDALRKHRVVLGADGKLYQHTEIFISDYPDYDELGLKEQPTFCAAAGSAEQFLERLGVRRLSKALCPRLISVEDELLDETQTQLMREVWLEPLLAVNYTFLDGARDLVSDRELLENMEIYAARRIRVQWFCQKGSQEIQSLVLEAGAFYARPILYVMGEDDKLGRMHMAQELARILAPEADPRILTAHYELILSHSTFDSIALFVKEHRYRSLPSDLTFTGEAPVEEPSIEPTGEPAEGEVEPTSGPQPGPAPTKPSGPRVPQPVKYVDTSKLEVVEESSATPDEAKPFCIGASAVKGIGYATGAGLGGRMSLSVENKETEAVAFGIIKKYEEDRGWKTNDNGGQGFAGFDIRAQRGKEIKYIEVKSSRGWNCPDLSFTQLSFAKKKRQKYYLYRVHNLEESESPPVLYIVQDPWGYLDLDVAGYTAKGYKHNPKGDIKKVVLQEK